MVTIKGNVKMYLSKIKSEKTAGDRVAIIAFSGSLLLTWSVIEVLERTLHSFL